MQVQIIAECSKHSAILSTLIKLPFFFKIFVLSIFEWPLKTGFTVFHLTVKHFYPCFVLKEDPMEDWYSKNGGYFPINKEITNFTTYVILHFLVVNKTHRNSSGKPKRTSYSTVGFHLYH